MRMLQLLSLALLGGGLSGCMTTNGTYNYPVQGRLVDAQTRAPLSNTVIAIHDSPRLDVNTEPTTRSGLQRTDANGTFSGTWHFGQWTSKKALGLWTTENNQAASPPTLMDVYLYVDIGGQWQMMRIPLTSAQEARVDSAGRHVSLGVVEFRPTTVIPPAGTPETVPPSRIPESERVP